MPLVGLLVAGINIFGPLAKTGPLPMSFGNIAPISVLSFLLCILKLESAKIGPELISSLFTVRSLSRLKLGPLCKLCCGTTEPDFKLAIELIPLQLKHCCTPLAIVAVLTVLTGPSVGLSISVVFVAITRPVLSKRLK